MPNQQDLPSLTGLDTTGLHSPQKRLGKYELQRLLGMGGMGQVWLATDTLTGVEVALKMLPPELRFNKEAQNQILESYKRVHNLHHPAICSVKDLILDGGVGFFLVMDYFPGITLSQYRTEYFKTHGGFPIAEVVRVLSPVAEALDYAHSVGLVHRDVKPANVLIAKDGRQVRVIDFQLATEIRSSLSLLTNGPTNTSGTYPYMAPEQFAGQRATALSDVYALAMTAYHLLAGRLPYETHSWEMWSRIVSETKNRLPEIDGLAASINAALSHALNADLSRRPTTCVKLLQSLSVIDSSFQATTPSGTSTAIPAAALQDPSLETAVAEHDTFVAATSAVESQSQSSSPDDELRELVAVKQANEAAELRALVIARQAQEADEQRREQQQKQREAEERRQKLLKLKQTVVSELKRGDKDAAWTAAQAFLQLAPDSHELDAAVDLIAPPELQTQFDLLCNFLKSKSIDAQSKPDRGFGIGFAPFMAIFLLGVAAFWIPGFVFHETADYSELWGWAGAIGGFGLVVGLVVGKRENATHFNRYFTASWMKRWARRKLAKHPGWAAHLDPYDWTFARWFILSCVVSIVLFYPVMSWLNVRSLSYAYQLKPQFELVSESVPSLPARYSLVVTNVSDKAVRNVHFRLHRRSDGAEATLSGQLVTAGERIEPGKKFFVHDGDEIWIYSDSSPLATWRCCGVGSPVLMDTTEGKNPPVTLSRPDWHPDAPEWQNGNTSREAAPTNPRPQEAKPEDDGAKGPAPVEEYDNAVDEYLKTGKVK